MSASLRLLTMLIVAIVVVGLLILGGIRSKQMRVPFFILAGVLTFVYIVSFIVLFIL